MKKNLSQKTIILTTILFCPAILCILLSMPTANAQEYSENITFILFNGKTIASLNNGEMQYQHHDRIGNVVAITNEASEIIYQATYNPFGGIFWQEGENTQSLTFTGKELDNTSQHYFGARYYDSNIGRFTTVDSWKGDLARPLTLNRYTYVMNNPYTYTDPNGKQDRGVNPVDSSALGEFKQTFDDYNQFKQKFGDYFVEDLKNAATIGMLGENKDSAHISFIIKTPIKKLNLEIGYSTEDLGFMPDWMRFRYGSKDLGIREYYDEERGVYVREYVTPSLSLNVAVTDETKIKMGGQIVVENFYSDSTSMVADMRPGSWGDYNFITPEEAPQ